MELVQYPIKFIPILKERIWGGNKITTLLNKRTSHTNVGESWEISAVGQYISEVENGVYKGKSLTTLISNFKESFVGNYVYKTYGNIFPLLFKFIDAKQDLSIQLHPDDSLAWKRHQSFGKTEMWYIVQADKDSRLILGFNKIVDKHILKESIQNENIETLLNSIKVQAGDSFLIPPGTVHAIGAGILLAEIQQSSDITYRLYDWGRKDMTGNLRELHIELALDAINYNTDQNYILPTSNQIGFHSLVDGNYFCTAQININDETIQYNVEHIDSFIVYMCVSGQASIEVGTFKESIMMAQTIFLPANVEKVKIQAKEAKLLQVYIAKKI